MDKKKESIIPLLKSYWYVVYQYAREHGSHFVEVITTPPLIWIHNLNKKSEYTFILTNWKKLEGEELQGKEHFLVE